MKPPPGAEPAAFGIRSLTPFAALGELDAVHTDPAAAAATPAGRAVLGAVRACGSAN